MVPRDTKRYFRYLKYLSVLFRYQKFCDIVEEFISDMWTCTKEDKTVKIQEGEIEWLLLLLRVHCTLLITVRVQKNHVYNLSYNSFWLNYLWKFCFKNRFFTDRSTYRYFRTFSLTRESDAWSTLYRITYFLHRFNCLSLYYL